MVSTLLSQFKTQRLNGVAYSSQSWKAYLWLIFYWVQSKLTNFTVCCIWAKLWDLPMISILLNPIRTHKLNCIRIKRWMFTCCFCFIWWTPNVPGLVLHSYQIWTSLHRLSFTFSFLDWQRLSSTDTVGTLAQSRDKRLPTSFCSCW